MNNTQKLYLMQQNLSVMFLSSKKEFTDIEKEGLSFLKEEIKSNGLTCGDPIVLTQVIDEKSIPPEWNGAPLWGTDHEITATEFLKKSSDPEYILYLTLKNKFENK